ncbi:MAG: hypothetical protein JO265_16750 [Acidimicrobiia bacterium]|nr:hypothetical protein [Acidimicrobiia bacterium]
MRGPSQSARRLAGVVLLATLGCGALASCRPDTVQVAFRPPVGAQYRYQVVVSNVRTIQLGSDAPQRTVDDARIEADETVLTSGPEGVRVRVELRRSGSAPRLFVVLFDRAAQLTAVETIEGLPASVLEPFGLSEIFPAAGGAPPVRPLRAGEQWTIDDHVALAGSAPARLRGSGRLVSFGVVGGRNVASIRSSTQLPVTTTSTLQGGQLALYGTENTVSTASRELGDGAVEEASSTTGGNYQVVLTPGTQQGTPVTGTLTIEVQSQTKRLR